MILNGFVPKISKYWDVGVLGIPSFRQEIMNYWDVLERVFVVTPEYVPFNQVFRCAHSHLRCIKNHRSGSFLTDHGLFEFLMISCRHRSNDR